MTEENTVTIEVNGQSIKARKGAMLIEATDNAGIIIPRFCYHKKLSIAANCRMCLVEVQKAPKPLPACATPVMEGMVVYTQSPLALSAQKGTMEFLLINHPLDCPICDQGGECELQDISVGFGSDLTRYTEKKRVVVSKDIGPLIATDMTRCIHCTRCVRFGDEISCIREMGATGRGEHMQIGTYIEQSVNSELSGNIIDLCPVGALTAKPSLYQARAWELKQVNTIAPHDAVGSNISVHVRRNKIIRVAPRENETINECWISDRDRFGYEGVYSDHRVTSPMINNAGEWETASWDVALNKTVEQLKDCIENYGIDQIGLLVSPTATIEEMYLAQKMIRELGGLNIDHRCRQIDFSDQNNAPVFPALGIAINEVELQDTIVLIGSHIRHELPIIAHKIRKAANAGAKVISINPIDLDLLCPVETKIIASNEELVACLAYVAKILYENNKENIPEQLSDIVKLANSNEQAAQIADVLKNAEKGVIFLGGMIINSKVLSVVRLLAAEISRLSNVSLGYLTESCNTAGAWISGVLPHRDGAVKAVNKAGLNVAVMLEKSLKGYVLIGLDPGQDFYDPAITKAALTSAECVIAISSHATDSLKAVTNIILPMSTHYETSGTYVNMEGLWQSFNGAINPLGDARPGWKILRVLGNLFNLEGFNFNSSVEVLTELQASVDINIDNTLQVTDAIHYTKSEDLIRVSDVSIYGKDMLVRAAPSLQKTSQAQSDKVRICQSLSERLGLNSCDSVNVKQQSSTVQLPLEIDERVADNCVWITTANSQSQFLGGANETIELSKN